VSGMSDDRGKPIAYMVLEEGTAVVGSDSEPVGKVDRVLADAGTDIFDGLLLDTPEGDRFVDAPQVAELYERLVILDMTAADALRSLPEPTPSPASVDIDPDDIAGDTTGDKIRDAARRAWDRISGNY
jgi:hypothetical protein